MMKLNEAIEYIREKLGEEELAQAALKLRRCITKKNPTPVKLEDAEDNLTEELADILLVAKTLRRWSERADEIEAIAERKTTRWANRIEEANHEN